MRDNFESALIYNSFISNMLIQTIQQRLKSNVRHFAPLFHCRSE